VVQAPQALKKKPGTSGFSSFVRTLPVGKIANGRARRRAAGHRKSRIKQSWMIWIMDRKKRSFARVLIAQWPAFVGFGFIGLGLLTFWNAYRFAPHQISTRAVAVPIAIGIVFLGYWALANRNDDYNF